VTDLLGKTERIYTRVSGAEKMLIAEAAEVAHRNVSDFVLESALREATNTLLDQRLFSVGPKEFAKFEAALAAPAEPNAGLIELVSRKAPWA